MHETQPVMVFMPPLPDLCPVCASGHAPEQPHNAESLYYQMTFHAEHGRWPTWLDAMALCDEQIREYWTRELAACGVLLAESPAPEPT